MATEVYSQNVFIGGVCDNPIDAGESSYKKAINLVLDRNGKLYQRPYLKNLYSVNIFGEPEFAGSGPAHIKTPWSVSSLFDYLIFNNSREIGYFKDGETIPYTQILLPTGQTYCGYYATQAGPYTAQYASWDRFPAHLIHCYGTNYAYDVGTSVGPSLPAKIFYGVWDDTIGAETPALQIVTAGLPRPEIQNVSDFTSVTLIGQLSTNGALPGSAAIGKIRLSYNGYKWVGNLDGAPFAIPISDNNIDYHPVTFDPVTVRRSDNPGVPNGGKFVWDIGLSAHDNFVLMAADINAAMNTYGLSAVAESSPVAAIKFYYTNASLSDFNLDNNSDEFSTYFVCENYATGAVASNRVVYYIVYKQDYYAVKTSPTNPINYDELIQYTDRGPAAQIVSIYQDNPGFSLTIPAYAALANTNAGDLYKVDPIIPKVQIEIYRTTVNGTEAYLVATLDNEAGTYSDNISDDALIFNLPFYGNGGVLENDPPGYASFSHTVEGTLTTYWGGYRDESTIVRQSKQGDFDSVPLDNYIEFDSRVTGISSVENFAIVGTEKSVYRVEGQYDDVGDGVVTPVPISSQTGVKHHCSMVKTDFGTFFAGNDGFYWTDGYKVLNVNPQFKQDYIDLADSGKAVHIPGQAGESTIVAPIYGMYDKKTRRIYWTMADYDKTNPSSVCFCLDLNYPFQDGSAALTGPFVTLDPTKDDDEQLKNYWGQMTQTDSGEIFVCPRNFVGGTSTRINNIFRFTHYNIDKSGDILMDEGLNVDTYKSVAVKCGLMTRANDFGDIMQKKWVTNLKTAHWFFKEYPETPLNGYFSNASRTPIQVTATSIVSNNDLGRRVDRMRDIFKSFTGTITTDAESGQTNRATSFFDAGVMEFKWRFPSKSLRCYYKQLSIESGKAVLFKSSDEGQGTVNQGLGTLFVASAPFEGGDAEYGYVVTLSADNYQTEYYVTSSSNNTLVLSGALPVTGLYDWILSGIRKDMFWNLNNYVIGYTPFSQTQTDYSKSDSEN